MSEKAEEARESGESDEAGQKEWTKWEKVSDGKKKGRERTTATWWEDGWGEEKKSADGQKECFSFCSCASFLFWIPVSPERATFFEHTYRWYCTWTPAYMCMYETCVIAQKANEEMAIFSFKCILCLWPCVFLTNLFNSNLASGIMSVICQHSRSSKVEGMFVFMCFNAHISPAEVLKGSLTEVPCGSQSSSVFCVLWFLGVVL